MHSYMAKLEHTDERSQSTMQKLYYKVVRFVTEKVSS